MKLNSTETVSIMTVDRKVRLNFKETTSAHYIYNVWIHLM